jgi:hypothetical protein
VPESRRRKSKGGAAARATYSRPKPRNKNRLIIIGIIAAAVLAGIVWLATRGNEGGGSATVIGSEVTTATGLKYIDRVEGTGPSPQPGQAVTVHYVGTLPDGTQFDSSVDKGQPYTFKIGRGVVVKGWDEGIMSMKVGGKRKLIVPPELGYGGRARSGIPPNSTLLFEVELLGVN